jgi:hypothetical protein
MSISPAGSPMPRPAQALLALQNLMEDCGDLVETVLQWIAKPTPTARVIDREMGAAGPVLGGGVGMLTYHRYNAMFTADWFEKARLDLDAKRWMLRIWTACRRWTGRRTSTDWPRLGAARG